MTDFCIVQTTTNDEAKAAEIASALVAAKLSPCVQIGAVVSHYMWKGSPDLSREYLVSIKARQADFAAVAKKIRALHNYDLPEIIAVPILAGDAAYLDWMARGTKREDDVPLGAG